MNKLEEVKKVIQKAVPETVGQQVKMTVEQLSEIACDVGYFQLDKYLIQKPIQF